MSKKLRAAIIGPGNIGTDLLMKAMRSDWIEPVWMVGIEESEGIKRARDFGMKVSTSGVDGLVPFVEEDNIQIAFDATSAYVHADNSRKLNEKGVIMIDLTPAAIGPYCIPPVNLEALLKEGRKENVNMVTCGGQATIPMVAAVSQVQEVEYGEIVATVASKSIGPGTRKNIDEFTRTTAGAIEKVGGAKKGKAIIVVNPAEPPLIMRDTIHCLTKDEPNQEAIIASVHAMVEKVQQYVPGYRLINGPIFDGKRVTVFMEVEGLGDFLPKYSGNLDIMTAAGLRTAELYAEAIANGTI
ncbi:acetaldehyde dehydrogenase (acetylating) [Gammaproteobacteria bacterium 45_16_T64]|nr:acetaldehyde dehydrogenase (acetylating) [Gammaproteobacteria bacterium 45_16_T64]